MTKKVKRGIALILAAMLSMNMPLEAFANEEVAAETADYTKEGNSKEDSTVTCTDDTMLNEEAVDVDGDTDESVDEELSDETGAGDTSADENSEDSSLQDTDNSLIDVDNELPFERESDLQDEILEETSVLGDVSMNEAASDNEIMAASENMVEEVTALQSDNVYKVSYKGTTYEYVISTDVNTKKEVAIIEGFTEGGIDMEIPSSVELNEKEYPVTEIAQKAFYKTNVSGKLVIPGSIETIGNYAFYDCDGLTELSLGDGVKTIVMGAFKNCTGLKGNLVIPDSVKSIEESAFENCAGLEGDLVIPGSVKTIGASAFKDCKGLNGKLVIQEGVTSIGVDNDSADGAFEYCQFTGDIKLPKSLKVLGRKTFFNCQSFDGTLTMPSGLTVIGEGAFYYCAKLKGSINIPSTVKSIGKEAFLECEGLDGTLTIPKGVTSIGDKAFYYCTNLKGSLNIPGSVVSIGDWAFYYCEGLDGTLTINKGVTNIGDHAFAECTNLNGSLILPDSVKTIGDGAFQFCKGFVGNLKIPEGVTKISSSAFYSCSGLNGKLTLPKDIEIIEQNAFNKCKLKCDFVFPENLKSIGNYAFSGCECTSEDVIFPEGTISVGGQIFSGCNGLGGTLIIPSTITKFGDMLVSSFNCVINNSNLTIPLELSGWKDAKTLESITDVAPKSTAITTRNFSIVCSGITDKAYTGSPIKQEDLSVKFRSFPNGKVVYTDLQLNRDYTVAYKNNTNVGTAELTITGKGSYKMKETITFAITPKNIGSESQDINEDFTATIKDMVYTAGKERESKPVIKYGKLTLKEGRDYFLDDSGDLLNPGKVTVTVRGIGNYTGSFKTTYTIYDKANDLSKCVIEPIPTKYYSGSEIELSPEELVVYKDSKKTEVLDSSYYRVLYENNINTGTATVTIKPASDFYYGGIKKASDFYYSGSKKATFKIAAKPVEDSSIDIDVASMVYTGSALKPEVNVTDNGKTVDAANYSVSYSNNINVPAEGAVKKPTVTVTFKKNYKGKMTQEFTIEPMYIGSQYTATAHTIDNQKGKVLTVKDLKVDVVLKQSKKKLVLNKDYTLDYTYNPNSEWQTVKIKFIGNYKYYSVETMFKAYRERIDLNDVPDLKITYQNGDVEANYTNSFEYTGKKICPDFWLQVLSEYGNPSLEEGVDYTVTYSNNINVGKETDGVKAPTITIKGKGAYTGTIVKTFNILPLDMNKVSETVSISDMKYTGKELKPQFTINAGARVFKRGVDYDYKYVDNIEPGTNAKVVITYKGNYTGSIEKNFRIYKYDISTVTVDKVSPMAYTGYELYPTGMEVYADKSKTKRLCNPSDYQLEYSSVKIGTGTVKIIGKGEYGGTKTVKFSILPRSLYVFMQ